MRRALFVLFSTLALVAAMAPAQAITRGEPDNGAHPYVGELLFWLPNAVDPRFDDPGSWSSCTGTLIDPTHVLTAGHCTFDVGQNGEPTASGSGGNDVWISFSEAPDFSILPPSSTFVPDRNQERYEAWAAALDASDEWVRATAYPHPEYDDAAFFLHDLGVLVLSEPVQMDTYGELPTLNLLDRLYAENKHGDYTAVGYGLEESGPHSSSGGDTRMVADVMLTNLNGVYGVGKGTAATWSSNNGKKHRGGTCYGDSGGPTFQAGDNTVLTVTSFGIDVNCAAGGGGYRVDQEDDLNFLATFGLFPPPEE